jgi:hypothetical protein
MLRPVHINLPTARPVQARQAVPRTALQEIREPAMARDLQVTVDFGEGIQNEISLRNPRMRHPEA